MCKQYYGTVVGAVGKSFDFQPQDPGFDPQISLILNICVTFFLTKTNSASPPSGLS